MRAAIGQAAWTALRLRSTALSETDLARLGPWLILAPHPDDETLGAGALIAKLAAMGLPARIVFVTDGSASHIDAPCWPPERIARTRRTEAERALRELGAPPGRIDELGWPDAGSPDPGDAVFESACARLAGLCRRERIGAVATTWRGEGHGDHRATFQLGAALRRRLRGRVALFEYLVWGWSEASLPRRVRRFDSFMLRDPQSAPRRGRAIRRHRTQISPMIGARGFRLPAGMLALAERDPAILLRARGDHAP